jgi:putative hydrolase of the HAD superfamily
MSQLTNIRAVTFDVGGTLIEPWPSVGHVYAEVAERQSLGKLSPEILNERFKMAWRGQSNFTYTREAWSAIVDETFRDLVSQSPRETFFPALYERFAQADAWHIFDDVKPTLSALAASGIRLGIISNWDERLRPLLTVLGLAKHFEVIVVSCEAGATKPSPLIFRRAFESFELPPGRILHIGDSAELDVAGAQAAGMQALEINRHTRQPTVEQIVSLIDLIPMFEATRSKN